MVNKSDFFDSRKAATQIYHNLIRTMVFLHRDFDPARAWQGLPKEPSFPQFKTLMTLRYLGPCTLKKLAETLGISAASSSEMIDRLFELGLVDRRQDTADRRRVQVSLTHRAVKGVQRHEAFIHRRLCSLMDQIGLNSSRMWLDVFNGLSQVFDDLGHGSGNRLKPPAGKRQGRNLSDV